MIMWHCTMNNNSQRILDAFLNDRNADKLEGTPISISEIK